MLDLTKPMQTKSGLPARLIADDLIGHSGGRLVFAIQDGAGETLGVRQADGKINRAFGSEQWDIINTPPVVLIEVRGGMAEIKDFPPGVLVKILDYDIDGLDQNELSDDGRGRKCNIISAFKGHDIVLA